MSGKDTVIEALERALWFLQEQMASGGMFIEEDVLQRDIRLNRKALEIARRELAE